MPVWKIVVEIVLIALFIAIPLLAFIAQRLVPGVSAQHSRDCVHHVDTSW